MIYIAYFILALIVITFSIKVAGYVDLIDKKTNISGVLIGGALLAAVTSLPEFFTSLSATVMLGNSELVLGNILGSNIFNFFVLGIIIIFFTKGFIKEQISKNHTYTLSFVFAITLILFIPLYFTSDASIFNISIVSIVTLIFYFRALKFMAQGEGESEDKQDTSNLTIKQVITRFTLSSVGLVIASILITNVTDIISEKLNLSASLSGALFLGIATSLPEVTSCIALAKKSKFNLVVGNLIGSNIFNLFIIAIMDVLYIGNSIYFSDKIQTKLLLVFVFLATIIVEAIFFFKRRKSENKFIYLILSVGIIITYISYLLLSL